MSTVSIRRVKTLQIMEGLRQLTGDMVSMFSQPDKKIQQKYYMDKMVLQLYILDLSQNFY